MTDSYNESAESQQIIRLRHMGTEPQLRFWNSPKRYRAFVGGVGSGKTRAGVVELLRQPPGSRVAVVAPTYRMLEDATIQTFKEVAGAFYRPDDFRKSENKVTLQNGTEILFRSADEPDKLRGPNLSGFWLDEGAMMSMVVWDLMIGRLRLEPGRGVVTTTPRGKNWLFKLFVTEGRDDYELIQCSSRSNTFLPSYFIKTLEEKYSGHWLKQELEGEFVEFIDAAAYEEFKSPVNVYRGEESLYDPRLPIKLACDFNHMLMAWPVIQIQFDQPVVVAEISQLKQASIQKMVQKFRAQFPTHAAGLHIYGDASGKNASATGKSMYEILEAEFAGYLSEPEFFIPKKNPPVKDRVHSMNLVLKGVNHWRPLLVDKSCEYLLEDFQRVQWKENGNDVLKILDSTDDRSLLTHASDATGYWVMIDMPSSMEVTSIEDVMKSRREEIMQSRRVANHGTGFRGI